MTTTRTSPWPHGAPCWATLATADEPRARAFYGEVLGWSFRDAGPRQHDWTLAEVDDRVVAGIGAVPDAGRSAWLVAFATDDLAASAAAVVNAGGTVQQPPHDVLAGAARAAVGRSRSGMQFALLQADGFAGASAVNRPGALVWEDGVSDDPAADREFHATVLGWAYTAEPRAGDDFVLFGAPGDPRPWGGLGGNPDGGSAHWCLWFGVESVDAAVDAAVGLGGWRAVRTGRRPVGPHRAAARPGGGRVRRDVPGLGRPARPQLRSPPRAQRRTATTNPPAGTLTVAPLVTLTRAPYRS